jgi:hypothetical protein
VKPQEDDQGPPRGGLARILDEEVIKHPADLKRLLRHFPDSFISRSVEINTMRRKVNRPKSNEGGVLLRTSWLLRG